MWCFDRVRVATAGAAVRVWEHEGDEKAAWAVVA